MTSIVFKVTKRLASLVCIYSMFTKRKKIRKFEKRPTKEIYTQKDSQKEL